MATVSRRPRPLPYTPVGEDMAGFLKTWSMSLRSVTRRPPVLKAPRNFSATSQRGGILLNWAVREGADGYEILRSDTPDFSSPVILRLAGGRQTAYFDTLGGSATTQTYTKYYKIRATSGTDEQPQSVVGALSGIVSNTSIATTDAVTGETTERDPFRCVRAGTTVEPLGENAVFIRREFASLWVRVETANGCVLDAVPEHPVYTDRGKTQVQHLKVGEDVITKEGMSRVVSIECIAEDDDKLVVTLDQGHLYWANGILSHNRKYEEAP